MKTHLLRLLISVGIAATAAHAGAPVPLQPLPNLEIPEDSNAKINLNAYFKDPDSLPLRYAASTTEDSANVLIIDSTLYFYARRDWNGTSTILIVITSKSGQTLSATLQGRVRPVNDPPVQSDPAFQTLYGMEDSVFTLDVGKHFRDPDGTIVGVEATSANLTAEVSGLIVNLRGRKDWFGKDSLILSLTDDSGAVAKFRIDVEVSPVDDPPFLIGMPPDGSIQANGSYTVDFSAFARDVDDSVGKLTVVPDPVPGVHFQASKLSLTVQPTFRLDTVTVTGKIRDTAGLGAPFSFKVACNAGFRNNALNIWPNLGRGPSNRGEPLVLMDADGSFEAFSATDSAVLLDRYRPDGTKRALPQVIYAGFRDTVRDLRVERDGATTIVLLASSENDYQTNYAIKVFDQDFQETHSLRFAGSDTSINSMVLDTARNRVLLACYNNKDVNNPQAVVEMFDYSLNKLGSKLVDASTTQKDSAFITVQSTPVAYSTGINSMSLVALPDKYAVFWVAQIRTLPYYTGIQYSSLNPDLSLIDSAKTVDAAVNENPILVADDISDLSAYTQWGQVYLSWINRAMGKSEIGIYPSWDYPTLRLVRLDGLLNKSSAIRKLGVDRWTYYGSYGLTFLEDEILAQWNTTDSYLQAPRQFQLDRFAPDLTPGTSSLLASDTLDFSPQIHVRNGQIYMISRRNPRGEVIASLADGSLPISLRPPIAAAHARAISRWSRSDRSLLLSPGGSRWYDANGRRAAIRKPENDRPPQNRAE